MNERIEPNGSKPSFAKVTTQVVARSERIDPSDYIPHTQFRLAWGLPLLEKWSLTAGQVEKNAMYEALFAVADRTVFKAYKIHDDVARPLEFTVLVREDLVLKIHVRDLTLFGIAFIGVLDEAPGQALTATEAA